jgi:hypothetical protein
MSKISHTSAPRLYETAVPSNGADAYYDISDHTMAAQSNKSFNKKTNGTFGSTGRDSNSWLNKGGTRDENTPRSGTPNGNRRASHTPSDMAPLRSTFGANANAHRQKGPSAAMGGGSRFAPTKQAAPGPGEYYTPPALGAQKSGNFNKSGNGTMGTTKRFQAAKEAAPGDYSDARPGAFTKSQNGRSSNTGFGGTVSRVSVFELAANAAAANASSHLSYDAHASTGAFAKAMQATGASSAAFASKSSQHGSAAKAEGERGADFLNLQASGSMAKAAGSSFNKSLKAGTGGFGTSAKRGSDMLSARSADAPGPGEYDLSQRVDSKPSAAFASTTKKEAPYVRDVSDGAGMSEYDAHKSDGMAATASKSFNRHVGTGGFGPRAAREMHGKSRDTPGPGEYQSADPSKPTVDNHAKSSKGKVSGAFASTTLRDTSSWAIPGMR